MATGDRSPVLVQHMSPPHMLVSSDNSLLQTISDATMERSPSATEETAETERAASQNAQHPDNPQDALQDASRPAAIGETVTESLPLSGQEETHQEESEEQTQPQEEPAPEPEATFTFPFTDEEIPDQRLDPRDQNDNPGTDLVNPQQDVPIVEPPSVETSTQPEDPTSVSDAPVPAPESQPKIPEWVTWEDDMSTPTEAELEEVKDTEADADATNVAAHEKMMFPDHDDPDQRPAKKIRLSWVIKGVRGTKERPNKAKQMNSPTALIDGLYWRIKFFPRGNKCSSLSAYIQCTKKPPEADKYLAESTFAYFEGPPDADIGHSAEPKSLIQVEATTSSKKDVKAPEEVTDQVASASRGDDGDQDDEDDYQDESTSGTVNEGDQDYRASAQLGMVIYNPQEPRTATAHSSEHQFCPNNSDWGWTNFVPKWEEIHKRKRGERQALLREDTIAIDAYIRIFDDPTKALWWHSSTEYESQWPAKRLAGYWPMGTPPLYHSPGVAGMSSWLLLAPFRKVLQEADTAGWRSDAHIRPRPFITKLQKILHMMRHQKHEEYVNVHRVIEALHEYGETRSDVVYGDVEAFWEPFRRAIELELGGDQTALAQLSSIFDVSGKKYQLPRLPVRGVGDIQTALTMIQQPTDLPCEGPDFLPLFLERDAFDKISREWKMHHDRVKLNDEITLPFGDKTSYTLYGFIVHLGARNSGRFYSILRPDGPGTRWLAFEDGDGNKIFSYTNKMVEEYEGLVGEELDKFNATRRTAYMAMYIRSDRLKEYLPGTLEDYSMPKWIQDVDKRRRRNGDTTEKDSEKAIEEGPQALQVEVYLDQCTIGRQGLLDMFSIKQLADGDANLRRYTLSPETRVQDVRKQLLQDLALPAPEHIRLSMIRYGAKGEHASARWTQLGSDQRLDALDKDVTPLCLWAHIFDDPKELELFGVPDVEIKEQEAPDVSAPENETAAETESGIRPTPESGSAAEGELEVRATPEDGTAAEADSDLPPDVARQIANAEAIDAIYHSELEAHELDPEQAWQMTDEQIDVAIQSPNTDTPSQTADQTSIATPEAQSDASVGSGAVNVPEPVEAVAEQPLPVEHGHLVDAVVVPQGQDAAAVVEEAVAAVVAAQTTANVEMSAEDEAAIAALIAADTAELSGASSDGTATPAPQAQTAEGDASEPDPPSQPVGEILTIDDILGRPAETTEQGAEEAVETSAPAASVPEPRPVPAVYGFIQMLDIEAQDFRVHSSFFARHTDKVREVIRAKLSYAADREFNLWYRTGTAEGKEINGNETFLDCHFIDGVDIIVGDVLGPEQTARLRAAGKFSNPFELSHYLRLRDRKHPRATPSHISHVDEQIWGQDAYSGPLIFGRRHGADCTLTTATGQTYVGPLECGAFHGPHGKMTYQNADTYVGGWANGEPHGPEGTFVQARTGNKYVGGWREGKRWGKGTTHWLVADEEADLCQICYGEVINALFYDCGHVCSCVECAKQCEICPICRRSVRQVVRMFKV
jgi:hypothetical protein